jgi:hypothetical protein
MRFLKIFFWEFIQNIPIFTGFAWAFDSRIQGKPWNALACAGVGGISGAILIALTESRKVPGHKEPIPVVLINILAITAFIFALVVYLGTQGTNWFTDLLLGSLGGAGLGLLQSTAGRKKVDVRHCLALALASALAIIGIRILLNAGWSIWMNALSTTVLATLIICLIDYMPGGNAPGKSLE